MDPSLASALQAWKLETEFRDGERHHKVLSGVERWVEEKHLGNGTFGCVYQERCVSGPSASAVRAVKQILKYQSKLSHRELQALTTFSDARVPEYQNHFVRCLGWFEDKDKLYIAMEFIQHGDLHGYIRRGILPEPEAAAITAQVAQALRFMHQKGFVHRDLKPLNILVSRPAPDWHVKVADFGATKNMDGTKLGTHGIGTNGYVAPEQLDDSLADSYSPSVDIFALGAIVFCMCTGSPPFRSPGPLFAYVRDSSLFPIGDLDELTGLCSKFVLRAMAARASERATIDELLTHRWLLKHSGGNKGPVPAAEPSLDPFDNADANAWNTYNGSRTAATAYIGASSGTTITPQEYYQQGFFAPAPPATAPPASSSSWAVPPWASPNGGNSMSTATPQAQQSRPALKTHSLSTPTPEKKVSENISSLGAAASMRAVLVSRAATPPNRAAAPPYRPLTSIWDPPAADDTTEPPSHKNTEQPVISETQKAKAKAKKPIDSYLLTCLTCEQSFQCRRHLFDHLQATPSHAQDVPTKTKPSPEKFQQREQPETKPKPENAAVEPVDAANPYTTCLACHETFEYRDDLFDHLEKYPGHARDLVTKKPEKLRRSR